MGYYKDRNTNEIKIDEQGADIVREVFELYLNGYGLTTIAKMMNARGIKSPEYFSHRRAGAQRTEILDDRPHFAKFLTFKNLDFIFHKHLSPCQIPINVLRCSQQQVRLLRFRLAYIAVRRTFQLLEPYETVHR